MNRIVLICFLILVPFLAFADGKVNGIDGAVSIASLQNGDISVSCGDETIYLSTSQRDVFIDSLKKHYELLNTLSTEKVSVKSTRYTGTYTVGLTSKFGFWIYVNTYKDSPGVIVLEFNGHSSTIAFDATALSAFIKELENTKTIADGYFEQSKRVDELIEKLRKEMRE